MKILIGFFLYLFVVVFLIAFGKFLRACDESLSKGMKNGTMNRNRFHYPMRNLSRDLRH